MQRAFRANSRTAAQVATDALVAMEKAMKRDGIMVNDRQARCWFSRPALTTPQLACARIHSTEGQDYLKGMAAAANFAWVNRTSMTYLCRQAGAADSCHASSPGQAFSKAFRMDADDLDMHVVYDVSHNIAKIEKHMVDGQLRTLLVHRKGSTRAFPPNHPLIPVDYQA